jgi:hypothetical protein
MLLFNYEAVKMNVGECKMKEKAVLKMALEHG